MKALLWAPLILLLAGNLFAQQIGSVDLTHAPESSTSAQNQEKKELPGCKQLLPSGIGDSWAEPEDHQPRPIVLEIARLSNDKPAVGEEVQAEVRLRNSGDQSIQIPWSADPNKTVEGQKLDQLEWREGTFEVLLRGQQSNDILLRGLASSLYGSKLSPGTLLTIRPGEWITALIRFKIESEYKVHPGRFNEGNSELLVEWQQTDIYRGNHCATGGVYVHYDRYFQQQHPTATIEITGSKTDTN